MPHSRNRGACEPCSIDFETQNSYFRENFMAFLCLEVGFFMLCLVKICFKTQIFLVSIKMNFSWAFNYTFRQNFYFYSGQIRDISIPKKKWWIFWQFCMRKKKKIFGVQFPTAHFLLLWESNGKQKNFL